MRSLVHGRFRAGGKNRGIGKKVADVFWKQSRQEDGFAGVGFGVNIRKSDRENECRRVVGQGGTIWLKWIPYEGLITCNGKVIGCYGLDRIPIGDTNRLNIIFSHKKNIS